MITALSAQHAYQLLAPIGRRQFFDSGKSFLPHNGIEPLPEIGTNR